MWEPDREIGEACEYRKHGPETAFHRSGGRGLDGRNVRNERAERACVTRKTVCERDGMRKNQRRRWNSGQVRWGGGRNVLNGRAEDVRDAEDDAERLQQKNICVSFHSLFSNHFYMKKTLIVLLVGALLGSTAAFGASKLFADVPDDAWYTEAVENLVEKGIIQGYPDQTFRPSNSVNRAELVVIIDRLIEYIETGEVQIEEEEAIYSNAEYGFSFNYSPDKYSIIVSREKGGATGEESDSISMIEEDETCPAVHIFISKATLEQELDDLELRISGNTVQTTVDGVPATKRSGEITEHISPCGTEKTQIVLEHDENVFVITAYKDWESSLDKLLDSIKF